MPAPNIAPITKYTSRGKTDVYWVAAIADITAPTRLELNAGVNLKNIVADRSGFTSTVTQVPAPALGSRKTPTIAGMIEFEESSLTLYMDEGGNDAGQLMPQDEEGHIVWLYGGDVAGNRMSVFKVTVASQSPQPSVDGSSPDTMVISYAIADTAENLTVPV